MVAQKATLKMNIVDSTDTNLKNYHFEITVTNKSKFDLIIQDTNFMKGNVDYLMSNLITPCFYKKTGDKYLFFDAIPRSGVVVHGIDSCLEKCCGCITIKKRHSLKFTLNILACCSLEPGFYKLVVGLRQPFMGMKRKYLVGELISNEIYFSIK
jgi:hypothetical protein